MTPSGARRWDLRGRQLERDLCPGDRTVIGLECYCMPTADDPVWSADDRTLAARCAAALADPLGWLRTPAEAGDAHRGRPPPRRLPAARSPPDRRRQRRAHPPGADRRAAHGPRFGRDRRDPRRRRPRGGSPVGGALGSLGMATTITSSTIDRFRTIVGSDRVRHTPSTGSLHAKDGSINQGEVARPAPARPDRSKVAAPHWESPPTCGFHRYVSHADPAPDPRRGRLSRSTGSVVISVARMRPRCCPVDADTPCAWVEPGVSPISTSPRKVDPPGPPLRAGPVEPGGLLDRRQRRDQRRGPALPGLRRHLPAHPRHGSRHARRRGADDRRTGSRPPRAPTCADSSSARRAPSAS